VNLTVYYKYRTGWYSISDMTRKSTLPVSDKPAPRAMGPGRPKDLGKRAAILEAAKQMFLELGFNGVSMDGIAAQAGVSKLTVYSHFGDKDTLFSEAIRCKCQEMLPDELFVADPDAPLREQMIGIGHAFFSLVSSEAAIATQRMMMTPDTDDRLREMFWKAGPQRTHEALAAFLQARVARGELAISDVATAAHQFFSLIKGELHSHMMCGLSPAPEPGRAQVHIVESVELFLRGYAPPQQPE
jgi:TetR/AcrR family transcriptional repressor of mexJK operon